MDNENGSWQGKNDQHFHYSTPVFNSICTWEFCISQYRFAKSSVAVIQLTLLISENSDEPVIPKSKQCVKLKSEKRYINQCLRKIYVNQGVQKK